CQSEIPHLRTSAFPAAWSTRSANGNQPGRRRLQSEKDAEHPWRAQVNGGPANPPNGSHPPSHGYPGGPTPPKNKNDAPEPGTSLSSAYNLLFRNSLRIAGPFVFQEWC